MPPPVMTIFSTSPGGHPVQEPPMAMQSFTPMVVSTTFLRDQWTLRQKEHYHAATGRKKMNQPPGKGSASEKMPRPNPSKRYTQLWTRLEPRGKGVEHRVYGKDQESHQVFLNEFSTTLLVASVVSLHFVLRPQQQLPEQNILYQQACIIFLQSKASNIATSLSLAPHHL